MMLHVAVFRLVLGYSRLQLRVQRNVEVEYAETYARLGKVPANGHLHRSQAVGRQRVGTSHYWQHIDTGRETTNGGNVGSGEYGPT